MTGDDVGDIPMAPVDTSPRPEDGPQPADQEPHLEYVDGGLP